MNFTLCFLVLLPQAFYVEGSFMHEGFDVIHNLCASGILEQIKSVMDRGEMTCEEACVSIVDSTLSGMTLFCPLTCHVIQSGSSQCP